MDLVVHDLTLSIVSARLGVRRNFPDRTAALPAYFESISPRQCIQSRNEIAVASDAFNGTLLTSFSSLYEYALSFLFSMDHDCRLLVDNCPSAKPAGQDAVTTFSDHE
jgi:hypothetical protein